MKKITKIEDIFADLKGDLSDHIFGGKLIEDGKLTVLPSDDPVGGKFGCIIFKTNDDSSLLVYSNKIYDACEEVKCGSGKDFLDQLKNSLASNFPTFICHLPKLLRVGFLSLRNDRNFHFSIRLGEYKKLVEDSNKETKEI